MVLAAGQKLRVSDLTGGTGGSGGGIITAADVTVNNTTSLSDTGLTSDVVANATYSFFAVLRYSSGTAPDFKVQPSSPAGTTGTWALIGYGRDASPTIDVGAGAQLIGADIGTSLTVAGDTAGTTSLFAVATGYFVTTTAGQFKLRFGQRTATVSNTIARAGSFLDLTRRL